MTSEVRKPDFITFTGVDNRTSLEGMNALSARYPIEWGVLVSRKRQGHDNRYPSVETLSRLAGCASRLAMHVCGSYAEDIMNGQKVTDFPVSPSLFNRIQVNHRNPNPVAGFNLRQDHGGVRCIMQTRGATFPFSVLVDWLFDQSGGHGQEPQFMPPYPGHWCGYAGGLGPDNVRSVIERIAATDSYWIDMESKIRTDNWLDLDLCRAVCESVYG